MKIITGKKSKGQRIVLYGLEGIGKSTFAAMWPKTLFIDTEGSTDHMDVARTKRPDSWTELLGMVSEIKRDSMGYDTLVIDTIDWAQRLAVNEICAKLNVTGIEGPGFGKGYTYLAEEMGRLLDSLSELSESGMHAVLTAHAACRKFELPEEQGSYDRWELKLEKKVSPLVKEWADALLFARYKTLVIIDPKTQKSKAQGDTRVIATTHSSVWDAKNRHGLPDELPFDGSVIAKLIGTTTIPVSQVKPAPAPEQPPQQPAAKESPHKALRALMESSGVTEEGLSKAIAAKGYYPLGTRLDDMEDKFIRGRIIPNWDAVLSTIIKEEVNNG